MKTITLALLACCSLILFWTCAQDKGFEIEEEYITNEPILPDTFNVDLIGNWELYDISGGNDGSGYDAAFDRMIIRPHGVFEIYSNDTLYADGQVVIKEFPDPNFFEFADYLIGLEPSFLLYEDFYYSLDDIDKIVILDSLKLHLSDACFDCYFYHFEKTD